MDIETANLKLPLRTSGHVQMQRSVRDGFKKIDQAITDLQGGEGGGSTDPRVDTLVADVADLKSRVETLETASADYETRIAALEAAANP
ncbi:MAG: hypothetical protein PBV01_10445 [Brucella anthropi]